MSVLIKKLKIDKNRCSAEVFINGEKNCVWYEFEKNINSDSVRIANAFLVAFLPIAMIYGGSIKIEGIISKTLYQKMSTTYQDIMIKWYPYLNRVVIEPEKILEDSRYKKNKSISCFTGGVDAFYTLIKHKEEIDDLLYVWGFDIPLTEENFYWKVRNHLDTVAKKFQKSIIFAKTNLGYEVTNKYASWGDLCYGAAIASVILLMSNEYKICFMPSCNDFRCISTKRITHTY